MTSLARAALGAVTVVVAGCSAWFDGPEAVRTTCAQWLALPAGSQTILATTMIDSEDILESVREAQRQEPGASKASLIQDVVQSVTKNCEVMGEPDRLVVALTMQLYGGGRAYDGKPGTPAR